MVRVGIIADDLTGAMDTGAQFARRGLDTLVALSRDGYPEASVVAVSTDSRVEPAAEAYRRALDAAQQLGRCLVYKKIDSTVRGNIGAELDGVLDGLRTDRALVAPAFPEAGRTTTGGLHCVNGVPVADTVFGRDPNAPVLASHLPTLLAGQTRRRVGHLPLRIVEQGDQAVVNALNAEPAGVVVADAVERRHLRALGRALVQATEPWLPCGSAGLAAEWAPGPDLGQADLTQPGWPPMSGPVLVIAGSRHPLTAAQLRCAETEGHLTCVGLGLSVDREAASLEKVLAALGQGANVALTTTFSAFEIGAEGSFAARLAHAAKRIIGQVQLAGLVITGGDVLRAVSHALGARALRVLREVEPGVPAGIWVGGPVHGSRVVTKAGGLGDEWAIERSIRLIRGGFT